MDFTFLLIIITFISGLLYLASKISNGWIRNNIFIDFLASLFPILAFVLIFRSFLIEPYRIPSGSMLPNLVVGDFILVKKYEYGVRLPLSNIKIINHNEPDYGDVIVFQYPQDRKINYIKRVVGLPGDYIEYIDKQIFINGQKFQLIKTENKTLSSIDLSDNFLFNENNNSSQYLIMKNDSRDQNFSYKVPEKTYFVLGDNRDNSNDSRYWGPVPESHLIGKAFLIWMHFNPNGSYSIVDRFGTKIN